MSRRRKATQLAGGESHKSRHSNYTMLGIHLAAVLTTLVAAIIFGTAIIKSRLPATEQLVWLAAFIALPLQPLLITLCACRWTVGSRRLSAPRTPHTLR